MGALIDVGDYADLSQFNWHYLKAGYAVRNTWDGKKNGTEYMHRRLMKPQRGFVVDHANGNTLDNRRSNLRVCTQAQNIRNQKLSKANKTGFKGVDLHSQNKNFRAQIAVNGKTKHLGCFNTAEEAGAAYDAASKKYHGKFARKHYGK